MRDPAGVTEMPLALTAPVLRTDDDVLARVDSLIGPATRPPTLWLLLVDGDDRQARVVVPIDDLHRLDAELVDGLGQVLDGVLPDLATAAGPGSVVFVRERHGPDHVLADDQTWAQVLTALCRAHGIGHRGVVLSTPGGVRRVV